ncbi:MAG: hypothetical protein KDE21_08450, partial [Novosphingobium sp.]|nr:hypothetical protein [Novosphingobium sp.]
MEEFFFISEILRGKAVFPNDVNMTAGDLVAQSPFVDLAYACLWKRGEPRPVFRNHEFGQPLSENTAKHGIVRFLLTVPADDCQGAFFPPRVRN